MYQPQQVDVVVEMARAMEDGQLNTPETQRIMDASLAFGLSLVFGTVMAVLVRSLVTEALEPTEEKVVQPVIDLILPAMEVDILDRLISEKKNDHNWEKWPYEDEAETHGICPECRAKHFPKNDDLLPQTHHSIPRDELKRIAEKYGWWAARQAEALCPHNDIACVEREAKRLYEVVRQRMAA